MALSFPERCLALLLRFFSGVLLGLLGLVSRAAAASSSGASTAAQRKTRCVPPPAQELLFLSAVELARRIRRRQRKPLHVYSKGSPIEFNGIYSPVKCLDAVEAYIGRIKEVNPLVNAVVKDRFEEALQEARQVDTLLSEGHDDESSLQEKFPFLGVPVTIKEAFALHGLPNTSGLVSRHDILSTSDAVVVSRLKQAGTIPLGVTNCSELCMWYESSNRVYGRTNNPYDLECIVGGSSGGEGCILAAAGSVIGVGSDIGGSIRMPAFFNGVFGHKPTTGLVPNEGQFPNAVGVRTNFLCTGPMCRYAEDLTPLLKIMAGPNVSKLKLDEKVSLDRLKFYFMKHDGGSVFVSRVDQELIEAQQKVIEHMETELGVQVQHVTIPKMKYSFEIWSAMMSSHPDGQEIQTFTELLGDHGKPVWPSWEMVKWSVGMSSHTLPAIALGITEKFVKNRQKANAKLESMAQSLQAEVVNLLGDDGVLLYPSHPVVAPKHHAPLGMPFNFAYTAIFNVLGLPVTQCPLGLNKAGLPLGIQVVAGPHNDHLTLAMASYLETAFGGWVCPGTS